VRGLHRRRPAGARELCQPDSHQRRRHARQRPARRPVQAVKGFIELHALLPKGVKLLPEDVFARASYVLSAKVLDPQFQGQIKERLNSRDAVRLVSSFVRPALELWLNQHVDYGKKLAELAIKAAQFRQKAGQKVEKRKGSGVAVLPGKLTDCESKRPGPQRGVSGRGRFGRWQRQDGPRQGKPGHIAAARQGAQHLGSGARPPVRQQRNPRHCGRHRRRPARPADTPDLSGLRYGKVCILSDADVDGSHIQVLLLTLFFRHFPKLIENGHVYVARPPLFRVDVPARGKKPASKQYALDEGELTPSWTNAPRTACARKCQISRFKGLGEMNAEQLWDTTLNPDTRRLLPVNLGAWTLPAPKRSSPSSWARAKPLRAAS
jgi:topoisomerase IV subunit B